MSIDLEFLTLPQAADFLKCGQENIKQLVASYTLKCGVFVPGWTGHAIPNSDGNQHAWEGGVCDKDKIGKTYSYRCSNTGTQFKVRHGWIAQFWYLHDSQAYELATTSVGYIDVDFLAPVDGKTLHASHPEHFPWPVFSYWLDSDQKEPRKITWDRIWFRRADLLAIGGAPAERTESPVDRRKRLVARVDELDGRDQSGRMKKGMLLKIATEEGVSVSRIKQILTATKKQPEGSDQSLSSQLKAAHKKR